MVPYYCLALGIMWLMIWSTAAVLMGPLPEDLRINHLRRWPRWSVAGTVVRTIEYRRIVLPAVICVWSVFYVLSYAPILAAQSAGRLRLPPNMLDFFVPVQWLVDKSPLREPLLRWAAVASENVSSATRRHAPKCSIGGRYRRGSMPQVGSSRESPVWPVPHGSSGLSCCDYCGPRCR